MLLFPAPRPGAAGWLYCAGSSRPKFGSVTTVNLPKEAEETPAHLSAATCVQRPLPNTVKVWEEKHCPKETDWKPPPSRNGHPGCGWVRAAERMRSFSRSSPHLQRLKGRKGRPSCLGPGAWGLGARGRRPPSPGSSAPETEPPPPEAADLPLPAHLRSGCPRGGELGLLGPMDSSHETPNPQGNPREGGGGQVRPRADGRG